MYGYYSAYDHVVFSWLFGKMIDLPEGFPMYTIDLKQTLDELVEDEIKSTGNHTVLTKKEALDFIKSKISIFPFFSFKYSALNSIQYPLIEMAKNNSNPYLLA